MIRDSLGLDAFADAAVADLQVGALAAKVRYEIDPENPYPFEFTGHLRVRLAGGAVVDERQPHLRGGARPPPRWPARATRPGAGARASRSRGPIWKRSSAATRAPAAGPTMVSMRRSPWPTLYGTVPWTCRS